MKKTILKIIALSILVASTGAFASQYKYETNSLVAIEGLYSSFDVENDDTPSLKEKIEFYGAGLKIGAQTRNYRLFLSIRNGFMEDNYDNAFFYGGEIQYLMHFASFANFYLGVNGGYANMKFDDASNDSRELDTTYFGGDLGFNIHLGDSFDWEIGARVMKLSETASASTDNPLIYEFDDIVTGYTSIIFKYSMD